MSVIVYPYQRGLRSTKKLREAGCKVRYDTSRVRQGVAIGWGMQTPPPWYERVTWINDPRYIGYVSNKRQWAALCTGYDVGLHYTCNKATAQAWAAERGQLVVCRTVLSGHSGEGIVIARNSEQVVDAPLYSIYFPKQREYRIIYSTITGIVYAASKRLREDTALDRDDMLVRTMDKGWVYQIETDIPPSVHARCTTVGQVLDRYGLHLLAYDVAYNTGSDEAMVIEANSAWGLNTHSAELTVAAMEQIGETL